MTARRSLLFDIALVLGLGTAMLVEITLYGDHGGRVTPYAVVAVGVAVAPVLIRRRNPELALAGCLVGLFAVCLLTGIYRTIPFPSVLCGYTLAATRSRRRSIEMGILTGIAVLFIIGTLSPHGLWHWETPKNLALVALPLGLGMAEHERRRATEEETRSRLGEQRLLIARDVHDVVAHAMVAINVQAGVGAHLLDRDPEQARTNLLDIKRTSGEALADLRSTLGLLRDPDEPAPSSASVAADKRDLTGLAAGFEAAGLSVDFDVDPGPLVDTTTYRLVTEALTNVLRHASSDRATVRVHRDNGRVYVDVTDDGRGGRTPAQAAAPGSGHGLHGMRERAAAVGGTLEAGPDGAGGWRVRADLPGASS